MPFVASTPNSKPAATVWTTGRQWAGNLIPLLFWLPPTALGIGRMVLRSEIDPIGVSLIGTGVALGWLATNFFGALPNRRMRSQLERILQAKGESLPANAEFVGFATPRYSSALDPHEDVGFVVLEPDRLRFLSESRSLEIQRTDVKRVGYRFNVHTLIALGRWVSVDGTIDGRPVRMLFEPRTRAWMLGNLMQTRPLRNRIALWAGSASSNTP